MERAPILPLKIARRGWLLLMVTTTAVLATALYWWLLADLPPIRSVETRLVRPTTQILDRNGRLLYEVLDPDAGKQVNLDLNALPPACVQATIATEDSRFFSHIGVDPLAIARATWQNYQAGGEIVSGASTLTQQLARTLLLPARERYELSLRRKLREAYLAWRLEFRYTKDELLALYLNQTYYGNFAFGIEAAAQIFFAKPATDLSRAECALLAGLIQYPVGYNPLQDPVAAQGRQQTVLRLMQQAGYLTAVEREAIAAEPLRYRSRLFNIQAPHFVIYVQELLAQQLGPTRLRDGGLRVVTTLDLDLQRQAEQAIRHRLDLLNCRPASVARPVCGRDANPNRRVDNAAAVILDNQTGEMLAMVGSPDYFNARIQGNVNAAFALRQPGSAIKPLTYAAALDQAWSSQSGVPPLTPASIIADLPTTFYVRDFPASRLVNANANPTANPGEIPDNGTNPTSGLTPYTPINYDRAYHGPVSLRDALANSYNIPAVKVLDRVGVTTLQALAGQAGISTFTNEFGLALTLGGGEVKLTELTTAFGIFLNGARLEPVAILSVQSTQAGGFGAINQHLIPPARSQARPPVIDPATAYLITDILADPVARLAAFGEGSVLELPFAAAVKTGTTTDWRDNWTIGYSTERIVGVWVGNADNMPMLDVSGIDGAGPIWHDLMLAAHHIPPPPFSRPNDIVETVICAPSGLLPTPTCPRTRRERFVRGTEPTATDDQFYRLTIDRATGRLATADTPDERRAQRVFWLLPPEYHDWMVAQGLPIADCGLLDDCPPHFALAQNKTPPLGQPIANTPAASLVLSAPLANARYQIHPGLPEEHQRIEVAGYARDGRPWATLRLVMDGVVLAEAADATRIQSWWRLTPGEHRFWIEGQQRGTEAGDEVITSLEALVVVEPFSVQQLTLANDGDE